MSISLGDVRRMHAAYMEGANLRDVGAQFGHSKTAVHRAFDSWDLSRRPPSKVPKHVEPWRADKAQAERAAAEGSRQLLTAIHRYLVKHQSQPQGMRQQQGA